MFIFSAKQNGYFKRNVRRERDESSASLKNGGRELAKSADIACSIEHSTKNASKVKEPNSVLENDSSKTVTEMKIARKEKLANGASDSSIDLNGTIKKTATVKDLPTDLGSKHRRQSDKQEKSKQMKNGVCFEFSPDFF